MRAGGNDTERADGRQKARADAPAARARTPAPSRAPHRAPRACCRPACAKSGAAAAAAADLCGDRAHQLARLDAPGLVRRDARHEHHLVRGSRRTRARPPRTSGVSLSWSTALRSAPASAPSTLVATTFTPCTSTAPAARSTPCPEASRSFSERISFSSCRMRSSARAPCPSASSREPRTRPATILQQRVVLLDVVERRLRR